MATPSSPSASDNVSLKRVLGLPSLVFFGLAYMVPLTVFTTYGVVTQLTAGHLPAAYIATLAAMLFTAYSYGRMVESYPAAGSAYTYTRRAFGGHVGFIVGWALLLDYIFLPMINYLVIGIYMQAYFPGVPGAIWTIAAIIFVTVLNILGIRLVARANMLIIAFQLIFIVVFVAVAAHAFTSAQAPSPLAPFYSGNFQLGAILAGAAILCLSFLGFDAVSTLSEETPNPRKDIPRAIMLVTLIGGALFIFISWVGHMVYPDWQSFTDPDSAAAELMHRVGGAFLVSFFTAAYIVGCIASAMASQASVARILYAMGRDRVLPSTVFGTLSKRYATPIGANLIVGAISLVALFISLSLAASMISFGALAAFSLVNLSVIKHFFIDNKQRGGSSAVRYGWVPAIGFLLTLWLWTSLSQITFEVGITWVAIGLLYLAYLTRGFQRSVPDINIAGG